MSDTGLHFTQQRILDTATDLFSASGYNGVSMRDIARVAAVNQASIYRYYHGKRELFIAALDGELARVRLDSGQKSRLASSSDDQAAILVLFHIIIEAIMQRPALVRLVQFSVLEYNDDLEALYKRHFHHILQSVDNYLDRWSELEATQQFDNRVTIFAFIAAFIALKDFFPKISGDRLSDESLEEVASACAELWHGVLSGKSQLSTSRA